MKNLIYALILLTCTLSAQEKIQVTCSIPPMQWLVEQIGGDQLIVSTLLSKSGDPHSFALTPGQLKSIKKAQLVVACGTLDFESKLLKLRPDLLSGSAEFKAENEHVWLSTDFLRVMAKKLAVKLIEIKADKKTYFEANLKTFLASADKLEGEEALEIKKLKQKHFYSYHGVFYYLAKQHGLKETNIQVEKRTPSPRELLGIIKVAKRDAIRVIFMQEQFNERPAKMISQRTGARIVKMNPLEENCLKTIQNAVEALAK